MYFFVDVKLKQNDTFLKVEQFETLTGTTNCDNNAVIKNKYQK